MPQRTLTRRTVLGTSLAGMALLAIDRGGAFARTPTASPTAGPWSWTDVTGETIELPQAPQRIAAVLNVAAGLWEFGITATALFSSTSSAYPDGGHIAWGNLDPAAVVNVGTSDGFIDIEGLIETAPDLIVTVRYDNESLDSIDGMTPDTYETLQSVAPVLILNQVDSQAVEMQRIVDFAASLGADTESPEIVVKRDLYAAKLAELEELTAAKPDLRALFASFDEGEFYVAGPKGIGELKTLAEHGLVFANGDSAAAADFWETLSVEAANLYPADIAYIDVYSTITDLDALRAHPAYGAMPAIRAGQVGNWLRDSPLTYDGQAKFVEEVLVPLRTAEPVD